MQKPGGGLGLDPSVRVPEAFTKDIFAKGTKRYQNKYLISLLESYLLQTIPCKVFSFHIFPKRREEAAMANQQF